jgi:hypothetical protein
MLEINAYLLVNNSDIKLYVSLRAKKETNTHK